MVCCKKIRNRIKYVGLWAALVILVGGCQFSPQAPFWSTGLSKKTEPPLPDRITPFWTDTVLHQPKQPGVRGFGGRVYFYRDGNQDSIEVDGGLVVYAFDNEAPVSEASKPIKKYVFTADQFGTHMSRTDMGPSYSIWLPWDEVGGETRQLSLVTRFEGRDGGVVISDPTVKLLPGVNKEIVKGEAEQGAVRPASFVSGESASGVSLDASRFAGRQSQTVRPISDSGKNSRAMTIDLPPSFQRHLSSGDRTNRADGQSPQGASGSAESDADQRPSDGRPISGAGEESADGGDSRPASFKSSRTGASHLFPPGLRNTFRRNVKDVAGDAAGEQSPNGRPANWLVAPR